MKIFVYKHTLEISKCTKRGKRKEREIYTLLARLSLTLGDYAFKSE